MGCFDLLVCGSDIRITVLEHIRGTGDVKNALHVMKRKEGERENERGRVGEGCNVML